ncbi:MAG TPA: nucleotidyl transferase AbiEii/AbiGii toxin family protein [Candidatus Nanoarchaeia archaeon]|nr:nucleotidyl transferase AbiEii/AbiGii toxin family protein [Candidatus Nanoarchaeia archaeon]
MIPLILRLKKNAHKEIAKAQDLMMKAVYTVFDKAVLHGGTAIWRCYQGQRFSEDIDMYLPKDLVKIGRLFETFARQGLVVVKKKVLENSIYASVMFNRTQVRFEAVFKRVNGALKEYELVEGNYLTIYTLTPTELLREKATAYTNRRKIRDLYDVFFLARYVKEDAEARTAVQTLLLKYEKAPDEKELKVLILEGVVPSVEKMIEYLQVWTDHGKAKI